MLHRTEVSPKAIRIASSNVVVSVRKRRTDESESDDRVLIDEPMIIDTKESVEFSTEEDKTKLREQIRDDVH